MGMSTNGDDPVAWDGNISRSL